MDVQLQELVEKIRKDGVESAEAKAADIIKNAEAKAAEIVKNARGEAESIVKKASEEAERSEKASVSAISQAGRNLIIAFRDSIIAELNALIRAETASAYSESLLAELVPAVVKSWSSSQGSDDIAVLLSPSEAAKLESGFTSALKSQIAKGMELKISTDVSKGFRIGTKDGSAYYDFSAEAVADLFAAYLNPRVAGILKSAAKEL
ncbi:MAG: V-type ATP synthase subunit E [Spirochaetales bacterium]|nr:V-type ATP synthase subunit E [Spirochaetales bacterium]